MPYRKKNTLVLVGKWLAGGLGVAALGALYYFLATVGPGGAETAVRPRPASTILTAGQTRVASEIATLEERAAGRELSDAERLAVLEQAVMKQRALNAAVSELGRDQEERLERLERARATLALGGMQGQLEELWTQAEAAAAAGREAEALAGWREALRLQRKLNGSAADAKRKDFARETLLAQRIERAELAPLVAARHDAEARVTKATADEAWEEVARAIDDARAAQAEINARFPRAAEADVTALERYDAERARFAAQAQRAESEKRERGADAALAARRWEEAGAWYAEAAALQRTVNERAPQSRFASAERVDALERKRQTALAARPIAEAAELERAGAELLRARRTVAAAEKIAQASAKLAQAEQAWPRAEGFDAALKLKLQFLEHQQEKLRGWQDEIYARLLPARGADGTFILRGVVEQRLYAAVMTANPSRARGAERAVDSLTWSEAAEFCQRVGWVLGRPVRLPRGEELKANVADAPGKNGDVYAERASVAEWLLAEAGATQAPVIMADGGMVETAEKKSRAADRGFRFVVEAPRG